MKLLLALLTTLMAAFASVQTHAQERDIFNDFSTQLPVEQSPSALGADVFGERYDPYSGATSFLVTDVSLPGNNELPVAVQRSLRAWDDGVDRGFGWSAPIVPYLSGLFKSGGGWNASVPGAPEKRCSWEGGSPEPPEVTQSSGKESTFFSTEYWHGNFLNLPGQGAAEMLGTLGASAPVKPTSGGPYYWVTRDLWYFSCLPSTQNGVAGEGFLAVSPNGVRYYFDRIVRFLTPAAVRKAAFPDGTTVLSRDEYRALLTRAEDRFGNYVTYNYSGAALTSIVASDGRQLTMTYGGSCGLATVVAGDRIWNYTCSATTFTVTHPDGSQWVSNIAHAIVRNNVDCDTTEPLMQFGGQASLVITHPAGATGAFEFRPLRRGFSFVRHNPLVSPCGSPPRYVDSVALMSKTVSGIGINTMSWSYLYGPPNACYSEGTVGQCTASSPVTRLTTVNGPNSTFTRYTHGNRHFDTDGLLLKSEVGESSTVLRTTDTEWQFLSPIGEELLTAGFGNNNRRPVAKKRTVTQQGAQFIWDAQQFDAFGEPTTSNATSDLGYSRSEQIAYHHDTAKWVLGQVAAATVGGISVESSTFDPTTARPLTRSVFGRLDRTFTWHPDGTLWTVEDGLNKVTTLTDYKRGIPRLVQHPTGASVSTSVDDHGGISSVTDATGFTTTYGRDTVGRVSSVNRPASDVVAWAPTSIDYVKTTAATAQHGLPAGTWRRTETTGARTRETFYDALWRPILDRNYTSDGSSGERAVRHAFDHEDRETFVSYPQVTPALYTDLADGIDTVFDALGRVTTVLTDSELGTLTTQTRYTSLFKTEVTDARDNVTTTTYQAFDAPSYDAPMVVAAPDGLTTVHTRDVFGKPLTMTRSGSYESTQLLMLRRFVYDSNQRPCKTIEPDAGITVVDYDGASNLLWRASGQASLSAPADCQRTSVLAAERSTHVYDAMGRVLAIDHPLGTDDVGYTYLADGALLSATTGTLGATNPVTWLPKQTEWTYSYNKRRKIESESLAVDGKTFALDWNYNARGDLTNLVYPSSLSVGFDPNAHGEPRQVGSYATLATYHPYAGLAGFSYGNGGTRAITPNLRQFPQRILDTRSGVTLLDHTLTYDRNGNLAGLNDGAPGGLETRTLGYDASNRLTTASATTGAETYAYDPLDRVRRAVVGGVDRRFHYHGTTYRLDRIASPTNEPQTSYAWSDRGELSQRTRYTLGTPPVIPPTVFVSGFENTFLASNESFGFDKARRLLTIAGSVSHAYDAHNRRVRTTTAPGGTRYQIYSRTGELLYIEDNGSNERSEYLHLNGTLVAQRTRPLSSETATVGYLHSDHRGTPSVKSAFNGAIDYRSRLTPYGAPYDGIYRDGPGFTKHATDASSRLSYMQQRYYDSEIQGFISPDPVGASAQSFNVYWYANANPYTLVDPDGRLPIFIPLVIAAFSLMTHSDYANAPTPGGPTMSLSAGDHMEAVMSALPAGRVAAGVKMAIDAKKTHTTYTREKTDGTVYSGKTSGKGTPEKQVASRTSRPDHQAKTAGGYGPATVDKNSANPDAIRGREQQLIERHGGAQSQGGASGNAINGVSSANQKGQQYKKACTAAFGCD